MENNADIVEEVQTISSSATFYDWKYKHYFVIVEEGEKNIRACCKLCWKQDTVLCLKRYLQLQEAFRKVHKNVVLKAKEVERAKGKGK